MGEDSTTGDRRPTGGVTPARPRTAGARPSTRCWPTATGAAPTLPAAASGPTARASPERRRPCSGTPAAAKRAVVVSDWVLPAAVVAHRPILRAVKLVPAPRVGVVHRPLSARQRGQYSRGTSYDVSISFAIPWTAHREAVSVPKLPCRLASVSYMGSHVHRGTRPACSSTRAFRNAPRDRASTPIGTCLWVISVPL